MLVSLSNVVVTSAPDRWGRVGIDDGTGLTRLDDDVFEADDLLVRHYGNAIIGATLTTLTGVVRFQFGTYAVFPRSANDIIFGAAGTLAPSPPPHVDCVQHGKDFRSPDRSCRFPPMVAIADDDLASDQGMMWFEGMHIYTPTLATPEDCQALCNEHRTCEYWSYEAEYGKHLCYLKQASTAREHTRPSAVSLPSRLHSRLPQAHPSRVAHCVCPCARAGTLLLPPRRLARSSPRISPRTPRRRTRTQRATSTRIGRPLRAAAARASAPPDPPAAATPPPKTPRATTLVRAATTAAAGTWASETATVTWTPIAPQGSSAAPITAWPSATPPAGRRMAPAGT